MWALVWMPRALRELDALEPADRERIVAKLRQATAEPLRFFQRLKGSPWSRLRVGDHRVLAYLVIKRARIEIHAVRHRASAYRV